MLQFLQADFGPLGFYALGRARYPNLSKYRIGTSKRSGLMQRISRVSRNPWRDNLGRNQVRFHDCSSGLKHRASKQVISR